MRFEALGPLSVVTDDGRVHLRPAQRRLLASMLLDAEIEIATDKLIDRMWADSAPPTARNTLHSHMSSLRRRLPGIIDSGADWYRLDLTGHEFDVPDFAHLAAEAAELLGTGEVHRAQCGAEKTLLMWRGDPYPELIDVDAARGERARLTELYLSASATLAQALKLQGRLAESISLLQRLVAEHPLNEVFWEHLVHGLYLDGRQADALTAYGHARDLLGKELGVEPGPRLQEMEGKVLIHHPGLDARPSSPPLAKLPDYRTSFVGRDDDLSGVVDLLGKHSLVSITGGPGMGKTRLAIEVGKRVESRFPGGVLLIRLVGAGNEADVLATLASAVGVDDNIGDLDQLRAHLSERPSLLIIDNCEHVIGAVRRFVGQEGGGPLQVLATSRTTLGLPGERVWRLQPLEVPDAAGTDQECASVRLLADRVSAADASFSLDSTDTGDLSRLCRRAGGIPLALELTARWVPVVGLDGVADLTIESVPNQESPITPHHVSLARAIDWSVETLAPGDKQAFEAASLFNGSFSVDGLWSVCLPDRSRLEVARTVASLTDASLLTVERPEVGAVRYRMLEPLREHAKAGLRADSLGLIRERHAAHFVERAATIENVAKGPGEAATFREIDEEIADFRAAMRHLLDGQRHADAALIAASLGRYWFVRYLGSEAQRWFADVLDGEMDPHVRLPALSAAGWAAYGIADYEGAESRYNECLELARTTGDRGREGEALYGLARIHLPRRSRSGEAFLGQALSLFDETGAEPQAAECRLWLGLRAANAGEVSTAIDSLEESITVLERFGYMGLLSVGHRYLSLAAWHAADEHSARRHLELAESTARAAGDRRALGGALIQRGLVEGRWGHTDVAAAAITEALAPIPDNRDIDFCLIAFGAIPVLIRTRRWRVAGRLLAHLDRIYDEYGWTPLEERLPVTADFRSTVETGLTEEGLSPAFDPVSSMTMAADLTGELAEIAHG